MLALGIDPGTTDTGYGLVESRGSNLFIQSYGTIKASKKFDMSRRLQAIYLEVEKIINTHKPDAVIIEKGFYSKNVQSTIKLAQVNGVIMLASVNAGVPVFEYTPLEVKLAVVGYGAAKKEQVQHMVYHILKLKEPVDTDHAADALAVAICHINSKIKYQR
ncbi:MAG: crossover junction endodeoxyribonuclease RuvC [Nitrospirae bacterium]|nr:crossover junction endodeoxyribonuclease RuvC [Nitrospirota bacterium]